jgi:secreted trypsin-like serine protease
MRHPPVWLALAGLAGCTGAGVGESFRGIIGGAPSDENAVMALAVRTDTGRVFLCSASVVAPRVLLTAAHCLVPAALAGNGPVPNSLTFAVFPGQDIATATPSSFLAVSEVHADPEFSPDSLQGGNDVGVVILEQPAGVPPLAVNRDPIPPSLIGQPVRSIGYGLAESGDDMGVTAGLRREATLRVSSTSDLLLQLQAPEAGLCEGDSGGPTLADLGRGRAIIGVASFGPTRCAVDSPTFATLLDTAAAFLEPFLGEPADLCLAPMATSGGCAAIPLRSGARSALPALFLLALAVLLGRRLARLSN